MGSSGASENLKFSEFIDAVTSNKVASVTIRGDVIEGKFASPQPASDPALAAANRTFSEFRTTFRSAVTPSPEELLLKHKVKVAVEDDSWSDWWMIIFNVLPLVILVFFFIMISRQASGANQGFGFGRSKHKAVTSDKITVTFDDVAGVEEAKEELEEIVDYLKYPAKYKALGARIPKGVLLCLSA